MLLNASCVPSKLSSLCIRFFNLLVVVAGLLLPATSRAQTFVPNWVQESPATVPTARDSAAMAYDATHGQVVLFGGSSNSGFLNDTWVWNGATWTQESPVTSPPARNGAMMAYDAASGQMVLFGGEGNSAILNDTWVWDGANWTLQSPGASPSVRGWSGMAYDAASGQLILFGGVSFAGTLGDTWVWNGTTWTQQSPATSPSARQSFAFDYDAASGQVVLFGGYGGGDLGDTWVWNGTTWTQQSPATSPSARANSAMGFDAASGQTILFGGTNGGSLNDTWVWNGATWTQESPATSPSARLSATMAYDPATGQTVLFGGYNGFGGGGANGGYQNDTWVWGQGDFGSQAIGSTSAAQTLNFSIPASTTVGSIGVLTQGAANLDFTDAGGSTCTATTYSTATNCTVNVQFKPAVAGLREGAVVFFSGVGNTGTVLGSTPISGIGTGPQIAFSPGLATAITPTASGKGLSVPIGVAVDAAGDLLIADQENNRVVELTAGGGAATAISPSANGIGLNSPKAVALDGAGDLFIADTLNDRVVEVPAGGGAATAIDPTVNGKGLGYAQGVAVDDSGNLFIADEENNRVVEVPAGAGAPTAIDPTVNGEALYQPFGVTVDGAGDLFIADSGNGRVVEVPFGGGTPVVVAQTVNGIGLNYPTSLAVDAAGDLFIADTNNQRVVEVPAGGGTPSVVDTTAVGGLAFPSGVTVDGAGDLFMSDADHNRVVELQRSQAPTLSFATTNVGSTSTDSPQAVEAINIGNQALTFTGLSYPADFPYAGNGANPCTSSISLTAGEECDLDIEFTPLSVGSPLSEDLTLTDNNLNVAGAQQSVAVGGTATVATVTVTVGTEPVGALFEVDGTPYTSTQIFTWNVGTSHSLIASASYAPASTLYSFFAWDDGTATLGDTVMAQADVTYLAGYYASAYLLTAAPNNAAWGSVTPASPGFYAIGAPTTITATANAGYYFAGWTGANSPTDIASASGATTTLTMNGTENITANFAASAGAISSPGAVNFGSQAIGSTSAAQALSFSIPAGITVGSIGVLTTGAAGLDFASASGTTCAAQTYSSATNCIVNVQFKPAVAGLRVGAVVFFSGASNTGTVLGSTPISGIGAGPQIAYGPGIAIAIDPTVNGAGLNQPFSVAVDDAGDLFIADEHNNRMVEVPAGNGAPVALDPTVNGEGLYYPTSVAVDGAGNLFIASQQNYAVVEAPVGGGTANVINPTVNGIGLYRPYNVAVDGAGDLFIADTLENLVMEVPAGGGAPISIDPTVNGESLNFPTGMAVDSAGDLFIADTGNNRVVEVPAGGGTPTAIDPIVNGIGLSVPYGVAVDGSGDLFITDYNNRVVEVPAGGGAATAIAPTVNGIGLYSPSGVAVDEAGDLFIADNGNNRVVELQRSQAPSLSFATTNVGSTSTDSSQAVEAINIGNQPLIFTGLSYPADFPYAGSGANPCTSSTSLAAGEECDLDIDFTPLSAGSPLSENVTLTDNALDVAGAQQSIVVGGTATQASQTISFPNPGTQIFGTSPMLTATLSSGLAVTFTSSTTTVCTVTSGGLLTFFSPGACSINANQAGDAAYLPAPQVSQSFTVAAVPPSPPQSVTAVAGNQQATVSFTVPVSNGGSAITGYMVTSSPGGITAFGVYSPITVTGLSAGATYTFTVEAINAAGTGQMSTPSNAVTLPIPNLVVNQTTDDTGTAPNCSVQTAPGTTTNADTCSLRDALAFAASAGAANISFDSTVFLSTNSTAQNTINLTTGTLNIPSNTSVTGPTSGSGYTLANLVTVAGGGPSSNFSVFTVNFGVTAASINGLAITNGNASEGGGIYNGGSLTVTGSTFTGNTAITEGGGIFNDGTLAVASSTFSGNQASNSYAGGGIFNDGTLTVTSSTFTGNQAPYGVGIFNSGTLMVTNSTFTGNTAITEGGGIDNYGTLTLANNIVSGNTASIGPDVFGSYTDNGGNVVGSSSINLAALANYGGPTQTMLPLPGSSAICAGTFPNATAAGLRTDQRGFVFDNGCPTGSVDSGAVQSNYALSFTNQPGSTQYVSEDIVPAPIVALTESGVAATVPTSTITVTDTTSQLNGTLSEALASGSATFPNLYLATAEGSDRLTATLSLNPSLAPPLNLVSLPSSTFTVNAATLLAEIYFPAPGSVLRGSSVTFAWTIGTGVTKYDLWLGLTGAGSSDLYTSGWLTAPTTSTTVTSLPAKGATVYARLYSTIGGKIQYNDYTFTESVPASMPATMSTPASGSKLGTSNVKFTWTTGTGVTENNLWLGLSGPGSSSLYTSGWLTTTSTTVTSLPAKGATVYARLYSMVDGKEQYNDYTYAETTAGVPATMSAPASSSTLGTSDVIFTWTTGTGVTEYNLWLGLSGPGSSSLYTSGWLTTTSTTVTSLPAKGATVYARLYSMIGGKVQYNDYTYTEQ
jgi:List-Bact-rpt repeat protein/fibronectin type III domain protein/NHL repeat-containing protein/galactose oxidase-like protein